MDTATSEYFFIYDFFGAQGLSDSDRVLELLERRSPDSESQSMIRADRRFREFPKCSCRLTVTFEREFSR